MAGRIAIVAFHREGHDWYCVTDGRSLFEAVRNAVNFFAHPYWRGPKPGANEVYTVNLSR